MAITILKEPAEIALSRNPNWWGFNTDNLFSNSGTKTIVIISFPDGPLVHDTAFDITYNSELRSFLIKDYPDDSGLQIRSGKDHPTIDDLTLLEWCNQIIDALNANYYFSRDYVIELELTGSDPRVKLTARIADPKYDLELSAEPGINIDSITNGIAKTRHPNFGLCLQLLIRNSDNTAYDTVIQSQMIDVNDDGDGYYNISPTLTQSLVGKTMDLEQPDPGAPAVQRNIKTCRPYYIRIAESYGSKQTIRKIFESDVKWTMLGGSGKAEEEDYSVLDKFLVSGKHNFLKQEALTKNVTKKQCEWLSMVWLQAPIATLKLHVKAYFTVGDPAEFDAYTESTIAKYDKLTFPAGPTQLNLFGLYPTKVVTYYEVWLNNAADERVSEIRTYQLNYDYQPYARWFSCLSSLGGYDTFYTIGAGSTEYDLITQRASITRGHDFKFEQGETLEFDAELYETSVVLTGFIQSKRELKRFRDMFLSWNKFEIKNDRAFPIMLNSKSIKERKDDENLFYLEFETGYRFEERSWTEEFNDATASLPINVSEFWPPVSIADPTDMDHLYWRKTQTYNRTEIQAFIDALIATEAANHAAQQAEIDALQAGLIGKSNTDHLHDDRYVQLTDFSDFADAVGAALIYKGAWDEDYTVAPEDEEALPGYSTGNRVEHDLKLWVSLDDENEAEPGTDPAKWEQVLNDISDVETVTDRTWSSSKISTFAEPAFASGTTLQYRRGDKTWQTLNTTVVPEGSNLYFTNARVETHGDTLYYRKSVIDGMFADGVKVPQPLDPTGGINYPAALAGDSFKINGLAAGTSALIGGVGGKLVENGDLIIASVDSAGGNEAAAGADFGLYQTNIDKSTELVFGTARRATSGEALSGTDDVAYMTSAKVKLYGDSVYLSPTGSGSGLSGVVLTTTAQNVAGVKTLENRLYISPASGQSSLDLNRPITGTQSTIYHGTAGVYDWTVGMLSGNTNYTVTSSTGGHSFTINRSTGLVSISGSADLSGDLLVHQATGESVITMGNASSFSSGLLNFLVNSTSKNWRISASKYVAGALEFTPSTTDGGSTFTTPFISLETASGNIIRVTSASGLTAHFTNTGGGSGIKGTGPGSGVSGETVDGHAITGAASGNLGIGGAFFNNAQYNPALLVTNAYAGAGVKTLAKFNGALTLNGFTLASDGGMDVYGDNSTNSTSKGYIRWGDSAGNLLAGIKSYRGASASVGQLGLQVAVAGALTDVLTLTGTTAIFSGNISAANLLSSTYTPTVATSSNSSGYNGYLSHYIRVGNEVTVTINLDFAAISGSNTLSTLQNIQLPIPSAMTLATDLVGYGSFITSSGSTSVEFFANTSAGAAYMRFYSPFATTTGIIKGVFTYTIK